MKYEGRHDCGTVVEDELPEGYPVEEGVGLYCPRCREGFWSVPAPPEPEPSPPEPRRRRTVWPVIALIIATAVAVPVIVLLASGGDSTPAPPPAPSRPMPTATATATATATPAPPPARRKVTRGAVIATLPAGWHATRDGRRVVLRGPHRALITVVPGPRNTRAGRHRVHGREITTVRAHRRSWRITRYLGRGGLRVARSVRIR